MLFAFCRAERKCRRRISALYSPVEGVHPVRFKIIDKEHNAACAPGYGVRPKDGFDYRKRLYGKGDICNAKYAPTGKHGKHGHSGAARAAHNGGNAVGKGKGKEEKAFRPHLRNADAYHSGVVVEYSYYGGADKIKNHAEKLCKSHRAENAEAGTAFGAFVLARAKVLADKGGYGGGERRDGQKDKALNL